MIMGTMEADRVTEKRWRACILYDFKEPEKWVELQAETYSELLEKLKKYSMPFRVIIYRRLAEGNGS